MHDDCRLDEHVCFWLNFSHLCASQSAGFVKGFGWRPVAAVRLAVGPASESLQGRNPREGGRGGCRKRYGDWSVGRSIVTAANRV
jgi:hypothetical protein